MRGGRNSSRPRLTNEELCAVWLAVGEIGYPVRRPVQIMILTGQRRLEVLEVEWREFDLDRALSTILGTRAKNTVAHLVPLAPAAIELLRVLPRIGDRFVFNFFKEKQAALAIGSSDACRLTPIYPK